ncbi:hypothetical protein KBB12_03095 [Candidatus Woesebacteria bacterium]|nr:hypothetical protein [Candidatus Woesebacteria bacterium]
MSKRMKSTLTKIVILVVLFTYVVSSPFSLVDAQTLPAASPSSSLTDQIADAPPKAGLSLTISPVFLNLTAYTGKTVKSKVKLTNNNSFAERYKLSVMKFTPDAKGESIVPVEDNANDESLGWIHITQPEVVVQGKSSEIVEFEVNVPEYAFLGYYFGIRVQRANENFARTDTTKVVGQAVMPIMLDVVRAGDTGPLFVDGDASIYKRAELVSFTTSSWWYEYLPTEFEVKFRNTGKVHLAPFGDIIVQQGDIDLGSVRFNETGGNTLPGVTRTYTSSWTDGFIVREPVKKDGEFVMDKNGKQKYQTVIKWDSVSKMRIGKYTAKAIVVFNNGRNDVPLEALVSFWIIPWKILLVIALILALVIFGIKSAVSNLIR